MVTSPEPWLETEVFVAGGGPAGLAAAIAARQKGFHVTVADAAWPPIDKACGEGLMPDGVASLRRLGIAVGPEHGTPFRGIRFLERDVKAETCFPGRPGIGIRRTTLHRLLVQRAMQAGVSLLWGSHISERSGNGLLVDGTPVRCRWVIGADGQNSQVRRWAGLESSRRLDPRFGFRRHFRMEPCPDSVDVHWHDRCQLYLTPIGPAEVCVVVTSRDPEMRVEKALRLFPGVAARLGPASLATPARGGVSCSRTLPSVCRGPVALIGDASGSVDSVTGEGLSLCFEQALALAEALAQGNLASYESAHRRIMKFPRRMARLILIMDRRPAVRARVLRTLAAEPGLFSHLLALHVGASAPHRLGLGTALAAGRHFLAA